MPVGRLYLSWVWKRGERGWRGQARGLWVEERCRREDGEEEMAVEGSMKEEVEVVKKEEISRMECVAHNTTIGHNVMDEDVIEGF